MEKTLAQQPSSLIKVVLFGPESTGKTTLSKQLADHYNTTWAPEFMRSYLQDKWNTTGKTCEPKDILPIAKGQMQLEHQCAQKANQLLICDTNLLELKVYSEIYYDGFVAPELDKAALANHYDLYFLTYIDTPWEADDLRDRPAHRETMFQHFEHALLHYNRPYVLLKGNPESRLKKATEVLDHFLLEQKKHA